MLARAARLTSIDDPTSNQSVSRLPAVQHEHPRIPGCSFPASSSPSIITPKLLFLCVSTQRPPIQAALSSFPLSPPQLAPSNGNSNPRSPPPSICASLPTVYALEPAFRPTIDAF